MNFQTRPVRKFNHAFQELRPRSGILWTVVQINRQSSHVRKLIFDARPPRSQTVAPEVARFVMAEDQRQSTGQHNQYAKRNQFLFRRRIMIPGLGDFAFAVGP